MQPERVLTLNAAPVRDRRRFILYWMQAAQRAEYNHALEFAIERANELRKPVVAVFGLTDDFPEGNLRHYRFMLEGLQETRAALAERGIGLVILHDRPDLAAIELAADAAITVVDAGWLRVQRRWRENAARRINCPLYQVETNLIVPIDEASAKEEFSAGTFRPRITKKLERFLERVPQRALKARPAHWDGKSFDVTDIAKALEQLRIERDVGPVAGFHGGTSRAKKQLAAFIEHKLDRFEKERNDPNADCTSNMSPWLHFGQISPLYIAKEVMKTRSPGVEAFLEELIVRRELSHNFVRYNTAYDTFECLPAWARRTLNFHRRDRRGYD